MVVLPPGACAALTEQAGEPLAGTASTDGATLFLVRYSGRIWPRKAVEESELPEALKARLAKAAKTTAGRALLVRGASRETDSPELYIVRTVPGERFILRLSFETYEAMAELDFAEVAKQGSHPLASAIDEPLFLVCTHGRRDACCAARGTETFRAIAAMRPGRVLQTSHLGGHRFAAVTLSLPDGLCYGRVGPEEAPRWVEATEAGEIFDLHHLRGRVCFDAPTQAAELFLRAATAETAIDHLALESSVALGDGKHRTTFRTVSGALHELTVAAEAMAAERPASCGAEPERASRFVLVSHRA